MGSVRCALLIDSKLSDCVGDGFSIVIRSRPVPAWGFHPALGRAFWNWPKKAEGVRLLIENVACSGLFISRATGSYVIFKGPAWDSVREWDWPTLPYRISTTSTRIYTNGNKMGSTVMFCPSYSHSHSCRFV